MGRAYKQGDEPVTGYRLTRFLGRGGFGEVWHATAPGGTEVAFKIIDLSERTGLKEWRAVQRVKKIRHPNLTPILALWLRDPEGRILEEVDVDPTGNSKQRPTEMYFAMGLGDKSLLDRLKECKDQGLTGVPIAELLNYLEDASRALDHLNSPRHDLGQGPASIQLCDVKPQNVLIVGDAAQVCDFGLARVLGDNRSTANPAVTLAFAAPELLEEGKPSSTTDQYSLAMTYFYLRTGTLPFSRNDANSVILEALEGRLDLTRLNSAEQQVVRQALARKPSSRFATCLDMAREMRRAVEQSTSGRTGLVVEAGSEIVPGHKLVRCLGRGAYGEVWEAVAPGRIPVALKIIRDLDRAGGRGKQEFKALEIIQRVSHNGLMELGAYWLLDRHGQATPDETRGRPGAPTPATLIIATKLADKNMAQLLEEYHAKSEPGIPPRELISYMKQVAQAIDYLNTPRHRMGERLVSIQHRDIKPDNIMLVDESVKLTDFGLAKVVELEEVSAEIHQDSVGFTFHYAAPEVLRGRVTKWSDQYALAITYYHLRTGVLPFERATSAYELMMQQLEGRLDLSYLPEPERRVVVRATMVSPDKRFHTCSAFIESLDKAIPADGIAPLPKKPPIKSYAQVLEEAGPVDFLGEGGGGDRSAPHGLEGSLSTGREDAAKITTPRHLEPAPAALELTLEPDDEPLQVPEPVRPPEPAPVAAQGPVDEGASLAASPTARRAVPADLPVGNADDAFGTIMAKDADELLAQASRPVNKAFQPPPGLVEVDPNEAPPPEPPTGFRRRAATMIAIDMEDQTRPPSHMQVEPQAPPSRPPSQPQVQTPPPPADDLFQTMSAKEAELALVEPARQREPSKDPTHLALADWRKRDLEGETTPKKQPPLAPILAVTVIAVATVALVVFIATRSDRDPGLAQADATQPTQARPPTSPAPTDLLPTTSVVPPRTSPTIATTPIMPPDPLILGEKRAADPDFAPWLEAKITRLIREVEKPEDFARLSEQLAAVPPEYATPQLLAFRAECLLEGLGNVVEAMALIEESLARTASSSPQAYQQYVRARVHQQANEPIPAAKSLDRALQLDALSVAGFRRQRALVIFQDAVQTLRLSVDPKTLTLKTSAHRNDQAWLQRASDWPPTVQESPPPAAPLHLVLLNEDSKADRERLLALAAPEHRSELLKLPQGRSVVPCVLLAAARSQSGVDPSAALPTWVELVKLLRDDTTVHELEPVPLFELVYAPALACTERLPQNASPELRSAAAALWASKGKLLRDNPYEKWQFPSGLTPHREAAAAYGVALRFEPESQRRARAELYTARSMSLVMLGTDQLKESDWQQLATDAEAAIQADPDFAGGYYLRGFHGFEQVQRSALPAEAMERLQQSIADFDEAIRRATGQNASKLDLAYFYISRSNAHGQFGDNTPALPEREAAYRRSLADAQAAVAVTRELDLAWNALGIAFERMAWKGFEVNKKENYPKAEQAYNELLRLRFGSGLDAHVALGRLYVRWYADDGGSFDRLALAEKNLRAALELDPDHLQANFWLGRLRLAQAQYDQAMEALRKAARDPKQGPALVLNVAELLLRTQDEELKIANAGRVRELIEISLPSAATERRPIHAQLVLLRSTLILSIFKDDFEQALKDAEEAFNLTMAPHIKAQASEHAAVVLLKQVSDLANKPQPTDADRRRLEELEGQYIERVRRMLQYNPDSADVRLHAYYASILLRKYAQRAADPRPKRLASYDEAITFARAAKRVADQIDRSFSQTTLTPLIQELERARNQLRE